MSSVDVVDNGNDAKVANEVPMEVEGSSVDNQNKAEDQQPNTSSATGSGGHGSCPEVEMVSDVDCSISEND